MKPSITRLGLSLAALALVAVTSGCGLRHYQQPSPQHYQTYQASKPHPHSVWVKGHYAYEDGKYKWVPGHWKEVD